jgi:hypothetical protein
MMTALSDVAPAFVEMAHRIVWCVAATSGPTGEPRTRVVNASSCGRPRHGTKAGANGHDWRWWCD